MGYTVLETDKVPEVFKKLVKQDFYYMSIYQHSKEMELYLMVGDLKIIEHSKVSSPS